MSDLHGVGIGLRMEMAKELLDRRPEEVSFLEIHPENYMRRGGRYPAVLRDALEVWPFATHGLTMGFGSSEPFEADYLRVLRGFLRDVGTPWHSDHMCFAAIDGVFLHDLLPTPFDEESARTMTCRYEEAREALDVELAMENVSYYAPSGRDDTDEIGFVTRVLEAADAKILLDVNNVYVNGRNHGFDPRTWLDRVPAERVVQIHIAGHLVREDGFRIDTHAERVCEDVYGLLEHTLRRVGPRPVLLERDGNFPSLDDLLIEVRRVREIYDRATSAWAAARASAGGGAEPPAPGTGEVPC